MLERPSPLRFMAPFTPATALSSSPSRLAGFAHWLGEAMNHAFGNPREEAAHRPPPVGIQPYRDRPSRRR